MKDTAHDPTRHIAFVATECFPFVKVGGLADIISSLPKELDSLGVTVDVVLPAFSNEPDTSAAKLEPIRVDLPEPISAEVQMLALPGSAVQVFAIGDGHYFPRTGVYVDPSTGGDYPDQARRWTFFQQAALALLARECPDVDVVHCHEHQTALIPVYLDQLFRPRGVFRSTATVLTIHNLGYQGIFPEESFPGGSLPDGATAPGGTLEFFGKVNMMKGGILTADALTVVSPTYAKEIQTAEYGYGLEGVIGQRKSDLFGILNGIDPIEWDPETDTRIAARYSRSNPAEKQANRRYLVDAFGMERSSSGPVVAMVSRLDAHKGLDLLLSILEDLLQEDIRFVLLGTGDRNIESRLHSVISTHSDKAGFRSAFDDRLAHQVIAGADIFLMPSRYEPCGLTQMYALRYGTIPVVRKTGGLADTVSEFDPEARSGTGFLFSAFDGADFRNAIDRALALWSTPAWRTLMANAMATDFSWAASAERYLEVYEYAIRKRRGG